MKEKSVDVPFDVRDFVPEVAPFNKGNQQPIQNNEPPLFNELGKPSVPTESTEPTRRTSSKQRKASLDEYREQFLRAPKIVDRQTIFISRTLRDEVDIVVRRLGDRKLSVSGFVENLVRAHLSDYASELEQWKRM